MADITFNCPFCQQELTAPDTMAGQTLECPVCHQQITVPGGIVETPVARPVATDEDKGKTVRIELPPDALPQPEKHVFKIKRIQH